MASIARLAADLHAIDHLARVLSVRAGGGVGPGDELQARRCAARA